MDHAVLVRGGERVDDLPRAASASSSGTVRA